VIDELAASSIIVKSRSPRGVSEEAPWRLQGCGCVVEAPDAEGLSRKVAKPVLLVCVKGWVGRENNTCLDTR